MAFDAPNLTQHPLSAAYPAMSADDFNALMMDIERCGLREPITLLDGEILDGWHRHHACITAGVEPRYVEFAGGDPREFVISKNGFRRHLTEAQRAGAVVKVMGWRPAGRAQSGSPATLTNAEMAAKANVSPRTIRNAKAAEKAGLGDAVRDGKVSAEKAAEIAKASPQVQNAAKEAIAKGEKPAPVKTPNKATQPATDLAAENAELRERIAEMALQLEDTLEENASLARVGDADEKVAAALAEAKRYREQVRILQARVDGLMNEKNAMVRSAKSWQRKAEAAGAGIPKTNGAHA